MRVCRRNPSRCYPSREAPSSRWFCLKTFLTNNTNNLCPNLCSVAVLISLSFVLAVVAVIGTATVAGARELEQKVPMLDDPFTQTGPVGVASGVFRVNQIPTDTFYYGGTIVVGGVPYAAEPTTPGWVNRKMWTWSAEGFNGTPHSGLKLDGWMGVDNTAQTEDYFYVADNLTMGHACVIAGNRSLFCGATNAQSIDLCYGDLNGTGYGNNWKQNVVTKTYTCNSGNQVQLDYDYHNESEPGYDFTHVVLQAYDGVAGEWVDYDTLMSYTDVVSGHGTFDVDSYMASLTPPVEFRIGFVFSSDGGYSDEDGNFPTTCGVEIDNYVLNINGVPDNQNFEDVAVGGLPAGWQKVVAGCGDYAHIKHINDLPIALSNDPCVAQLGGQWCQIADSVLVFYDELTPSYPHPLCQDNYAKSPVIDFSGHPGLPGRFFHSERFGSLPMNEYIFMYWQVRYKPGCASGGWSPWLSDNYVYYTSEGTSCRPRDFDLSTFVPPEAEQAQVTWGVINYCDEDPWGYGDCTYTDNVTPYFDNVTFGVYGSNVAPYVSMRELDYWQDQFAEDGTLNPRSTADTRIPTHLSNFTSAPIFGDTLVCRGGADNMEVRFVFRMAKVGPEQTVTHPFFTTWFPGVTGGAWKEARMDTAEVTSVSGTSTEPVKGMWMCAFHEDDPIRTANGLPEVKEILPNNIFVPGTRVEYFLKARYTGSSTWFMLPDTTGGRCEEFEILPMYRTGYGDQPSLIVVDHFGQRGNWGERNSDRLVRHLKAGGFDFDVFHKLGPTSALLNGIGRYPANAGQIGGPGTDKYNWGPGATLSQFLSYRHCILNAGNVYAYGMVKQDVDMISNWLNLYTSNSSCRSFWLSGDQVARELNRRTPWGKNFLNNTLGATFVHKDYASQNNDYAYCLPVNFVPGGKLTGCTTQYVIRMNGCPSTYSVLGVSGSAPGAAGEREYDSQSTRRYAAVSDSVYVIGGARYKTFVEGYDNCVVRTDNSQGPFACGPDNFLTTWFGSVLPWLGYGFCYPPGDVTGPPVSAPLVTSLRQAFPNPMNPTAKVSFLVGRSGNVSLRVFDVSGRVIRTLVDGHREARAEPYEVIWDGTNDRGERVTSGVFFYQLQAPGYRGAKKLVILQ